MSGVKMNNVIKQYGEIQVIHGIDLQIKDGEFCVFVGPSGCGKSTLLRMVAGLEETTSGQMTIGTRDVTTMDPSERGVAMVFQTYALYPHMTVKENMGFGLKMNGHPKSAIEAKVAEASGILKLDEYLDRKPAALSGGQRQRVSIGRAIVRGPEVFLFDEPFGALDEITREFLNDELLRLFSIEKFAALFITHSIAEAVFLSTRVLVMSGRPGRIISDYRIPFGADRPHDLRFEPEFAELCGQINDDMKGAHG
jgi:lactose/L-arabinose transport system ATP-binding protein